MLGPPAGARIRKNENIPPYFQKKNKRGVGGICNPSPKHGIVPIQLYIFYCPLYPDYALYPELSPPYYQFHIHNSTNKFTVHNSDVLQNQTENKRLLFFHVQTYKPNKMSNMFFFWHLSLTK